MKKALLFLVLLASFSVAVNAQSSKTDTKKQTASSEQAALKDHVCTAACSNGNHMYAHGEKGHVCNAACAQAQAQTSDKSMALKDHVCTAACKNGNHVYSHGEKGHVCTDACKNM